MSIADWIGLSGLFITVWFALVAIHRAETASQLERILGLLEQIEEKADAFWLAENDLTDAQIQAQSQRLVLLLDRLDMLLCRLHSRLHIFGVGKECTMRPELSDACTLDVEDRNKIPVKDREKRMLDIHAQHVLLWRESSELFDAFWRKLIWW